MIFDRVNKLKQNCWWNLQLEKDFPLYISMLTDSAKATRTWLWDTNTRPYVRNWMTSVIRTTIGCAPNSPGSATTGCPGSTKCIDSITSKQVAFKHNIQIPSDTRKTDIFNIRYYSQTASDWETAAQLNIQIPPRAPRAETACVVVNEQNHCCIAVEAASYVHEQDCHHCIAHTIVSEAASKAQQLQVPKYMYKFHKCRGDLKTVRQLFRLNSSQVKIILMLHQTGTSGVEAYNVFMCIWIRHLTMIRIDYK